MRRVVITGAGTINALGLDVPRTCEAMREGRQGIGPLDIRDIDRLTIKVGAQVKGYSPEARFTRQDLTLYDRMTQFALIAADEAIKQSGLTFTESLARQSGVVFGTAGGGHHTQDDNYRAVNAEGKNRVHPFVVPKLMNNAPVGHISMRWNLVGPGFAVSSACASSNHAMAQAVGLIRSGAATVMITGGADAMLNFGGIKAWEGLRVMSNDTCRPFCATRSGMVQGEGAGVFVFEEYEHARNRDADILAEVIGVAMTSDAHDIVAPSRGGAARTMAAVLRDAKVSPDAVGYINAHGTGTTANDKTECAAIQDVFGDAADSLLVSSTKSMHGHVIGGTGAIELLACLMALRDGTIAPTIGHLSDDPECNLDIVPNEPRQRKVDVALSNAFAFGGLNAVVALKAV